MKKMFLIAAMFCGSLLMADTIKFEGDMWMPYNGDPGSVQPGFQVEIVKKIFEKAGHKVEYKVIPYSRALDDVAKGNADAIFAIYEADAKKRGLVITPQNLGVSSNYFFVKKGNSWKYSGPASLEGQKLGVIQDYDYGEINNHIAKSKGTDTVQVMVGDKPLDINLKKLTTDRITVTVDDELVVAWTAKNIGLADKIEKAGMLGSPNKVYVCFSPKNPKSKEYTKILTDGIKEMEKSGEIFKILKKYGVSSFK